jgi:hypothetical protein
MARFSFPSPGPRGHDDAWFRVGSVDVTTTILLVGLGVASILAWAVDRDFTYSLSFFSSEVRAGEVWRLVTWPLGTIPGVEEPSLWSALTLFFLYIIGRELERILGRNRFLLFVAIVVFVPAALGTALQLGVAGMHYVSLPCFVSLAVIYPQARSFFNIPLWVIAAVFVGLEAIQLIGYRSRDPLIFLVLVLATGLLTMKSLGVLDAVKWIPKLTMPKRSRSGRRRKLKAVPNPPTTMYRPAGPRPGEGLRQAEIDMLLDKIAAEGIDSLTREERRRLDEASRRLRDEKG